MSVESKLLIKAQYDQDPSAFKELLGQNTSYSQFIKQIIDAMISEVVEIYSSKSLSTVSQLDLDGNILFESKDAFFAKTKTEIKNIPGSVFKTDDYILIADSRNKRAIVLEVGVQSLNSLLAGTTDSDIPQDYIDFFNDIANSYQEVTGIGTSSIIWEYNSDKYITSFYKNSVEDGLQTTDTFLICENDGLGVPFSSRVIKVDYEKNILWSFGECYLISPRNAKPLLNGNVIIST